jgi:hypothetical protein
MGEKESLVFNIADIPVRLNFIGGRCTGIEKRHFNYVEKGPSEAFLMVDVHYSALDYPSAPEASCMEYERGVLDIKSRDFLGSIDPFNGRAIVHLSSNRESLESLLRVIYSILLVRKGGFLFHSCGMLRDGSGYLFFGPSGSGKSTVAEMSSGLVCLNDDVVAVRNNGSGFMVYSTPFSGSYDGGSANISAGLRGCYLLKKGREHRVEELHPGEALTVLWESVLSIERSEKTGLSTLGILEKLVGTLPVRKLIFNKDAGFWENLN